MIRQTRLAFVPIAAALAVAACAAATAQPFALAPAHDAALKAAIAAPTRTAANTARDRYRHPHETLAFFGVRPSDTVVEIWPGGGWYSEILAPYVLGGGGTYYAAGMTDGQLGGVRRLIEANANLYGGIRLATFPAFDPGSGSGAGPGSGSGAGAAATRVPDGSADVVLTFRNVHNWRMGYQRDRRDYSEEAFRQMYAMLRPGGTLGVVDHRLPEAADPAREQSSGYIKTSTVRRLAEAAGFRFAGASEVNANPRDSADWPDGVWTLPPTLRRGEADRDRYLAIGESDRMTLRFVKPE